ncbi:MAG: HEPN-associated N-terminal domain-containing protein [Bacteroidales bacterium]
MGSLKKQWIEDESRGYSVPDKKYVCASHFNDKYLQQYVQENSILGKCEYCGRKTQVIDLRDFMEYAAGKITEHYGNPSDEALYLESSFYDDDDEEIPGFKRVGCFISPSYADNFDSTTELLYELDLTTDDVQLNKDIEDCFIWDEWIQHHPYMMTEGQELSFMWEMFGRMVKHEQRFTFFKRPEFTGEKMSGDNNLMDILTELGVKITENNLCKELDIDTELYRCRFIDTGEVVDTFDKISSPPDNKAKQSRMSPAGISMFYGAFDRNTAVLESSPDGITTSGAHVVGKFKTKAKLKVLDLTDLPQLSFWIPSDWQVIKFLYSFRNEITKPIERDDRIHIEYVPSQVFTEYLRYIYRGTEGEKIDGIIYKSSLSGTSSSNVVVFYNKKTSADILELINLS